MRTRLSHAIFVVFALSSSALAQNLSQDSTKPLAATPQQLTAPNSETYGTASEVAIAVPAQEFNPVTSNTTFSSNAGRFVTNATGALEAGIHLPAGASITRVEAQACDTNAAAPGYLALYAYGSSGLATTLAQVSIGANTMCTLTPVTLSPAHTVNNAINSYTLYWENSGVTAGTIKIRAARVYYTLQVSTPPGTPTFGDVPATHPFYKFVEALYASGITAGCGNGNFCPDANVTRGQMAVFLSAALGLHWAP